MPEGRQGEKRAIITLPNTEYKESIEKKEKRRIKNALTSENH